MSYSCKSSDNCLFDKKSAIWATFERLIAPQKTFILFIAIYIYCAYFIMLSRYLLLLLFGSNRSEGCHFLATCRVWIRLKMLQFYFISVQIPGHIPVLIQICPMFTIYDEFAFPEAKNVVADFGILSTKVSHELSQLSVRNIYSYLLNIRSEKIFEMIGD